MIKGFLSIFISILGTCYIQSQDLDTIILKKAIGSYPIHVRSSITSLMKTTDTIPGIPDHFKNYMIYKYYSDSKNEIIRRKNKKMDLGHYSRMVKYIQDKDIPRDTIDEHIDMICDYSNRYKRIIIDADNNNDFSNDRIFAFPYSRDAVLNASALDPTYEVDSVSYMDNLAGNEILINHNVYENGQIKNNTIYLEIQPYYNVVPNPKVERTISDFDYSFLLLISEYHFGEFQYKNEAYEIYVARWSLGIGFLEPQIYICKKGQRLRNPKIEDLVDDLIFQISDDESVYLEVDYINGEYVTFSDRPFKPWHYRRDTKEEVKLIEGIDLDDNKLFIDPEKQDYTLMHFWGSWCGPCKKDFPSIVDICKSRENSSPSIQCIGIAAEYNVNKEVLNRIINQYSLEHPQIMDSNSLNGQHGLAAEYNIQVFPQYFLLDNKGEIVLSTLKIDEIISKINSK